MKMRTGSCAGIGETKEKGKGSDNKNKCISLHSVVDKRKHTQKGIGMMMQ